MSAERVIAAFASGSEDLVQAFLEQLERIAPGLPICVISEFPPPAGRWIPYSLGRTLAQNRARILDALQGKEVAYAAMILQPRQPFWGMRRLALETGARRVLCFNENLDHFALHPRSALAILRHALWRTRNFIRWETRPGGWVYTQVWRLFHPKSLRRPLVYRRALAAARRRQRVPALAPQVDRELPAGVSVVIPSRNGRELLERLMPSLLAERPDEVLVVDNGSEDGTAEWLKSFAPPVRCLRYAAPLSFAAAVNAGIGQARFAYTLVLNNDMVLEPGFLPALRAAFDTTPDLFCSTAQILFPPGDRRQETGKAVYRLDRRPEDYPVWCPEPVEGEDSSYVLYGSGGCSLFDTGKLRALGGFDESFVPAYVEDHDLGWRGWQCGWPSVLAAGARATHYHRSTTARYFSRHELDLMLEVNHLRHLARSVASREVFERLWREALIRLNYIAAQDPPPPHALLALEQAAGIAAGVCEVPPPVLDENDILALGSGESINFPGRPRTGKPLVLIASPYLPFPLSHGGAVRMFNLMKRAADHCDQVLIAFCEGFAPPAGELREIFQEIVLVRRKGSHLRPLTERPDVVEEHDTPVFRAVLRQMLRKHRPALVQLEFTQMAAYAGACGDVPVLLVEHDVTLDLYGQLLRVKEDWETRQQYERWVRFEREAWRQVACVVTMSEKDRAMVDGARRIEVLANGVDLERFQPEQAAPEPRRILFIGSFAHLPNLMALDWFLREAWGAIPNATLHVIAGARPGHYLELYRDRIQPDLDRPGIEMEGFVSDVRTAYRRAAVVIAPLLASAGTNIKIMEAMAMGKAIVSTPAGINGLALSPGLDVMVVEDGAQMARAICRLLENPPERLALERAARLTVERQFNWDTIARRQEEIYRELITSSTTRRESR